MPLVKRALAPVFISRAPLDPSVSNELEGVSLNTFAGIIRQLSNLSWHAENLFGELFNEANIINQRANSLGNKISNIKAAVVRLDPVVERGKTAECIDSKLVTKNSNVYSLSCCWLFNVINCYLFYSQC